MRGKGKGISFHLGPEAQGRYDPAQVRTISVNGQSWGSSPHHRPWSPCCPFTLYVPPLGEKDFMNKSEQTVQSEEPRNVCLGLVNKDHYEPFELMSTAKCFNNCVESGSSSCHLDNLQR